MKKKENEENEKKIKKKIKKRQKKKDKKIKKKIKEESRTSRLVHSKNEPNMMPLGRGEQL